MYTYEDLIYILTNYLEREDVVDTEKIVSAATLYRIMKKKFYQLKGIHNLKGIIQKKVNDEILRDKNIWEVFCLRKNLCNDVYLSLHRDAIEMGFVFGKTNTTTKYVMKKVGEKSCYCKREDSKLDEKLFNCASLEIMRALELSDEFLSFYQKEGSKIDYNHSSFQQTISNEYFKIKLNYGNKGVSLQPIRFKDSIDINHIQEKEWYGRVPIKSIIQINENTILKKTPIKVKSLSPTCKSVYQEYWEEIVPKEKVYQKKP